ncbi:MAG: hypothetical protein K8I27_12130 [Planctomycetes bacterium]|nr:hypothetical protein [Planctomycetota bacterium]
MSNDDSISNKDTRRLANTTETAMRLREKYTRRRDAIQRFTDRMQKSGFADEAELETLRAVGVSESEIRALVEKYGTP